MSVQRRSFQKYKKGKDSLITKERIAQLNSIGFAWRAKDPSVDTDTLVNDDCVGKEQVEGLSGGIPDGLFLDNLCASLLNDGMVSTNQTFQSIVPVDQNIPGNKKEFC